MLKVPTRLNETFFQLRNVLLKLEADASEQDPELSEKARSAAHILSDLAEFIRDHREGK